MARVITAQDTPESLAMDLLGDGRLTHLLQIPGWKGGSLPVGQVVTIPGERPGPPARYAASRQADQMKRGLRGPH